ncbi:site-specific integrase [Aeromonas media]|uniref:site-specific integrase n=1 Tax=Aeromonas media TaxID=651 RepID=UPI0015FC04A9|nr:site-specific integrase [Aeromonas media]
MATQATEKEYEKLAKNHYEILKKKGLNITAKNIADELLARASECSPGYWRKLRCALVYHQKLLNFPDAAERIQALSRPDIPVKAKQKRVKKVENDDLVELIQYFKARNDSAMFAAILLFMRAGIRPAELATITAQGNRLTVIGAKKSHDGKRGADRVLQFDTISPEKLQLMVTEAKKAKIGSLQDKLRAAGKSLWPARKSLPTFYSWRHQMGSELKASGLDRQRIAYIMGHQATSSVDKYGNRKSANGYVLPTCPADADLSHIRTTHAELSVDNKTYRQVATPTTVAEPSPSADSTAPTKPRGMAAFINRHRDADDDLSR